MHSIGNILTTNVNSVNVIFAVEVSRDLTYGTFYETK